MKSNPKTAISLKKECFSNETHSKSIIAIQYDQIMKDRLEYIEFNPLKNEKINVFNILIDHKMSISDFIIEILQSWINSNFRNLDELVLLGQLATETIKCQINSKISIVVHLEASTSPRNYVKAFNYLNKVYRNSLDDFEHIPDRPGKFENQFENNPFTNLIIGLMEKKHKINDCIRNGNPENLREKRPILLTIFADYFYLIKISLDGSFELVHSNYSLSQTSFKAFSNLLIKTQDVLKLYELNKIGDVAAVSTKLGDISFPETEIYGVLPKDKIQNVFAKAMEAKQFFNDFSNEY